MTSTSARAPNGGGIDLDALRPQLPALRAALHQQRQFRLEQLAELTRPDAAGITTGDPRELVAQALRAGAQAALADAQRALQRLDAGTYGRCVRCQGAVGLHRLEVLPAAALCMNCQFIRESSRC